MYEPLKCAEDLRAGELDSVASWVEQIHTMQFAFHVFTAEMQCEEFDAADEIKCALFSSEAAL